MDRCKIFLPVFQLGFFQVHFIKVLSIKVASIIQSRFYIWPKKKQQKLSMSVFSIHVFASSCFKFLHSSFSQKQWVGTEPNVWNLYLRKVDDSSPMKLNICVITFTWSRSITMLKRVKLKTDNNRDHVGQMMTNLTDWFSSRQTELELLAVFPGGCLKLSPLCHNSLRWLERCDWWTTALWSANHRTVVVSGRHWQFFDNRWYQNNLIGTRKVSVFDT